MKRWIISAALVLVMAGAQGQKGYGNPQMITQSDLRAHLEFLAHDLLEGRDTASRGYAIATEYIASHLKLWGLKPAGDAGSYFQQVPFLRPRLERDQCTLNVAGQKVEWGEFGVVASRTAGGTLAGELVYIPVDTAGAPAFGSLDPKGKVWLVRKGGVTDAVIEASRAQKAAGIVELMNEGSRATANSQARGGLRLDFGLPTRAYCPVIAVGFATGSKLLEGSGLNPKDAATGTTASPQAILAKLDGAISFDLGQTSCRNVLAFVEGSDPKLKQEFVMIGAHLDHLGVSTRTTGDRIYNGADDDGSGSAALLEMAHAFAMGQRPKRSVLLIWHTGEEKGLLGSRYWTNRPTVDLKQVTSMVNIDMIGRSRFPGDTKKANENLSGPLEVYIIGTNKLSSEWGALVKKVNGGMYNMGLNRKYDAPDDPERLYFRSDHYNYALKGIPVIFFFDGVHEDYHRVSDEVSTIDFAKYELTSRTIYGMIWELASRKNRLRVDIPLDKTADDED